MALSLVTQEIIGLAGPDTIRVFGNNSRRVFAIFQFHSGAGACQLSTTADGLSATAFADLAQTTELELLRHDVGELVTGELWLGNGGGIAPNCDVTVVEGVLI